MSKGGWLSPPRCSSIVRLSKVRSREHTWFGVGDYRGLEPQSVGEAGETLLLGSFLCLAATVIKPAPLAFLPWPGRFKGK